MKKLSVMVVEDSRVVREFLEHIIDNDPRLKVVASVGSGEEALKLIHSVKPDVISLDIRLPGMNGFETTKRIMTERPTPIVVVSSDVEDEELKISMNALRAGALAVVQKPVGLSHADYATLAQNLCTRLEIMSKVRVIRQRYAPSTILNLPRTIPATPQSDLPARGSVRPQILGLVASTGGPNALVRVLNDLEHGFPAPIVIVQHITPGFLRGFVRWLDEVVHLPVVEATHGMKMEKGCVYVAPAERHLLVMSPDKLQLSDADPVSMQRPSGTVLFNSMSRAFGASAVGVLLTGMGDDGALGMRDLYEAGAVTIAEDESSAVVFGMPAAAARLGAACEVLPLPEIGKLLNVVFARREAGT